MSYQVIARKYRPQRFSEVVGQEHVTQTLANAITQNRIAHAYLFVGPRGTGKTTIARIFAKCLNCTGGPKVDFPDDDPRCKEITEGRSMDVLEIDGASNRGIDEIRELRETVKYAPASSKFKIYIIDEVHMLTKEAFNALLKTLEEPPEHVKFMFATTEPEKVLPTILSRCQRFDLRRIPATLIVKHLGEIAERENVKIDEAALYAVARGAEGGMRDAESTLDQLISFCGSTIQEADVLSMFGLAARAQILALSSAIIDGNANAGLQELNEMARSGKDLGRLLSDLLTHFRNVLIYQVSKGDMSLLEVSESEAIVLREQGEKVASDVLTRLLDVLTDGESRIRDAASKKIFLELTLLRAIEARNSVSIESVLNKLQQMRGSGDGPPSGGGSSQPVTQRPAAPLMQAAPAPTPVPPSVAPVKAVASEVVEPVTLRESQNEPASAPAPIPIAAAAAQPVASAAETPELETIWTQLVEAVGRESRFIRTYLLDSHPVSLGKNVFTIGFDPSVKDHLALVDNSSNRAIMEAKLKELGRDLSVKFVQAETPSHWTRRTVPEAPLVTPTAPAPVQKNGPARSAAPAPATSFTPVSKEDFENDPLIKKALEIFKGQIVEVRA